MTKEVKTLQEEAGRLASQLKSMLSDANKREQVLKEARANLTEFKLELGRKTLELRRKSAEIKKLAEESGRSPNPALRSQATQPVQSRQALRNPGGQQIVEGRHGLRGDGVGAIPWSPAS